MRKDAEEKKLPPIYRGKWASASAEEVQAMKDKGVPFCYRFRVPKVRAMRGGGGGGHQGAAQLLVCQRSWRRDQVCS